MFLLNRIIFLFHIGGIFLREFFTYCITDNYYTIINISRLAHRLASANILYVKVFQSIALNFNWIDTDAYNILLHFTDNAPWSSEEIDKATLLQIAESQNLIFPDGIYPMNSGMISLVFNAVNQENKQFVIKIKRIDIERRLHEAIENLLFVVKCIAYIPIVRDSKISEIIHKSIDVIRFQTNFVEEVQNMITVQQNCIHLKYIQIPHVYQDVTNDYPNAIMMDYLPGNTIYNVDEADYEEFAKLFYKFTLITVFVHGFAHGDLHCGNVLFIKDTTTNEYKLGILDFGIVYKIDPKFKERLFDIAIEMFKLPPVELAEKALLSGIFEPVEVLKNLTQEEYDKMIRFGAEIIQDVLHDKEKTKQVQFYLIIQKLYSYMSQNNMLKLGIRPGDEFIKVEMLLGMAHGVTMTLCDNHLAMTNQIINELFNMDIINDYDE
jgi:predicted unusual protein kinase regulating ubiquinone biosynthesis (AarF/ABC1/UbiB family)